MPPFAPFTVSAQGYDVSTDPDRLDVAYVHRFLAASYWSPGVAFEVVARSIAHALCFGLYHADRQIGFARCVTDYTTMAYLADVFVDPAYRGRGLGVWFVEQVLAHPELQGLRRWMLRTRDAHGLYERFGFTLLEAPEMLMERRPAEAPGASPGQHPGDATGR